MNKDGTFDANHSRRAICGMCLAIGLLAITRNSRGTEQNEVNPNRTRGIDMTNSYVAYYKPGPNWITGRPLKDQPLKQHVDYLVGLHRNGKVVMGGPFGDGSGGLVVFTGDDILDIEDAVARDPGVVEGVLVATVKHWARIV